MSFPVTFGRERFEAPQNPMTGAELRRLFNVPYDDELFATDGPRVVGKAIEQTDLVDVHEHNHFLSMPPSRVISGASGAEAYFGKRDE